MTPGFGESPTPPGQIRPVVAAAARSLEGELGARLGLTESQRAAFYRAQVEEYTNGWKDGKTAQQQLAEQLTPSQALEFAKWGEEVHQKGLKAQNSQWLAQVERDLVLSPEQLSKLALKVDSRPEFPVPADVGVPWKEACQKQIDAELRLMSGIITSQQQAKYVDFRMNSPKSDCKLLESIHSKVGTQSSPH